MDTFLVPACKGSIARLSARKGSDPIWTVARLALLLLPLASCSGPSTVTRAPPPPAQAGRSPAVGPSTGAPGDAKDAGGRTPALKDPGITPDLPPGFGRRLRDLADAALHPTPPDLPEIFPMRPSDTYILAQLPPGRTRRRETDYDHAALRKTFLAAETAGKAWLVLFPDTKYLIDVDDFREEDGGVLILEASTNSEWVGLVRVVALAEGAAGFVRVDGRVFEVPPSVDGKVILDEIDPGELPSGCMQGLASPGRLTPPPRSPRGGGGGGGGGGGALAPPPYDCSVEAPSIGSSDVITVLVLVPDPSKTSCGLLRLGAFALRLQLDTVFFLSATEVTSRVIVEDVNDPPYSLPVTASFDNELAWVSDAAGHAMTRRNANNADTVFLQVPNRFADVGGRTPLTNVCLCKEFAYGVFEGLGNFVNSNLPHELGHVMGMEHDRILMGYPGSVDCTSPPFGCSSSTARRSTHVDNACNSGMVWWDRTTHILTRTIMGTPSLCRYLAPSNCYPPFPWYSHPPAAGTACPPAGAAWAADNRGQLLFAAPIVAGFFP
jgi:hypothetical protein